MHLLFRSIAWSMGATDLQSPKCGIREAGPALLQSRPPNFSARVWKNRTREIKRQCDLFLLLRAKGRVGREIFTSRPNFIRGRNRGGHIRPGSLCSRPQCALIFFEKRMSYRSTFLNGYWLNFFCVTVFSKLSAHHLL